MRRVSRALLSTILLVVATQAAQAQTYIFDVDSHVAATGNPNTAFPVNDNPPNTGIFPASAPIVVTALHNSNAVITISTTGSVNLRNNNGAANFYDVNAAGLHATAPAHIPQYGSLASGLVTAGGPRPTPIGNNAVVWGDGIPPGPPASLAAFDYVRYGSLVYSVNGGAWTAVYNSTAYDPTVAANRVTATALVFSAPMADLGMTTGSTIRFSIVDGSRTGVVAGGQAPDFWANNTGAFHLNVSIVPELDPSSAAAAAALALCLLPLLVDVKRRRRPQVA